MGTQRRNQSYVHQQSGLQALHQALSGGDSEFHGALRAFGQLQNLLRPLRPRALQLRQVHLGGHQQPAKLIVQDARRSGALGVELRFQTHAPPDQRQSLANTREAQPGAVALVRCVHNRGVIRLRIEPPPIVFNDHSQPIPAPLQFWFFLAFALAFAIKVPLFPFHTWLPDAHVEAPTAGSVILAGILLKMGTYGFLRFALPLFPLAAAYFAPALATLAVIGIIYGALVAMVQPDMKKLVAYSSVSHLGFVVLGIAATLRFKPGYVAA